MDIDEIIAFARKNGGFIRTSELSKLNADYRRIQRLIQDEIIEKVKNGLYVLKDIEATEEDLIANMFRDGVLCMNSALKYHGYIDIPPFSWHIAVDKDTSKSRFKIDYPYVKPYYMEDDQLMLGAELREFASSKMYIYNKERVICDCLKYESKMERSIYNAAIRKYINDDDKNPEYLFEYANKRRIYKKAKDVLGIWI